MLDSPGFNRRLAAAGLVAAPILFLISFASEPAWSDDAATYLADVAGGENRHAAWGGFFALGALALLPGLLGTARLLRGPRGAVGRVGAVVVGVTALLLAGLLLGMTVTEIAMVDPAADRAQMAALYDRTEDVTFATIVFGILWFGGLTLGTLVLAVGLLLRRVVPVWSPLLLIGWIVVSFALDSRLGPLVGTLLLLGALAPIAYRIARMPDEDWARWQPLPAEPAATGRATRRLGSQASA
jgi:hypothetical protein